MFQMSSLAAVLLPILAHQGGWDEMLMVVVPVGVFAALLYMANKRAAKLSEQSDGSGSPLSRDVDPRNDRSGPR
jgi:hypothetical protein